MLKEVLIVSALVALCASVPLESGTKAVAPAIKNSPIVVLPEADAAEDLETAESAHHRGHRGHHRGGYGHGGGGYGHGGGFRGPVYPPRGGYGGGYGGGFGGGHGGGFGGGFGAGVGVGIGVGVGVGVGGGYGRK